MKSKEEVIAECEHCHCKQFRLYRYKNKMKDGSYSGLAECIECKAAMYQVQLQDLQDLLV